MQCYCSVDETYVHSTLGTAVGLIGAGDGESRRGRLCVGNVFVTFDQRLRVTDERKTSCIR